MTSEGRRKSLRAGLGTVFRHDADSDVVRIATEDGGEVVVPGPDLRELLETLVPQSAALGAAPYDAVLDRARANLVEMAERVRREADLAPTVLSELLAVPRARRQRMLQDGGRSCTPALVYLALERSKREVYENLQRAGLLAEIGCEVARHLDPRSQGGARVRTLQAFAESARGNVLRVSGDLRSARVAFRQAREYLSLGDPTADEAIEIDRLEMELLRDSRDFSGALALAERAAAALLENGQADEAAEVLFEQAIILDEMGDPDQAIDMLARVDALRKDRPDDKLKMSVRHSWAICLARQGRTDEASDVFAGTGSLYAEHSSPLVDARRLWAEGIIALEAQRFEAAVTPLQRARETFERGGYALDLALVSLDLAAVLVSLARWPEARALAEATYRFVELQEVHPDALAALAVFRQAAVQEKLERDLLSRVARLLQRAPTAPPPAS